MHTSRSWLRIVQTETFDFSANASCVTSRSSLKFLNRFPYVCFKVLPQMTVNPILQAFVRNSKLSLLTSWQMCQYNGIRNQGGLSVGNYLWTPGIYTITNTVTGDVYVGQSSKVYERMTGHKSAIAKQRHQIEKINQLAREHGPDSFTVAVVDYCSYASLRNREIFWIKKLKPSLNGVLSSWPFGKLPRGWRKQLADNQLKVVDVIKDGATPTGFAARKVGINEVYACTLVRKAIARINQWLSERKTPSPGAPTHASDE
jgi:hypothetical protein